MTKLEILNLAYDRVWQLMGETEKRMHESNDPGYKESLKAHMDDFDQKCHELEELRHLESNKSKEDVHYFDEIRIRNIIRRCDKDLAEDKSRGGDRQSYNQIKAFHYDSIAKFMTKGDKKDGK